MKISVDRKQALPFPAKALVLFSFQNQKQPAGPWSKIDIRLQKKCQDAAKRDGFRSKANEVLDFTPEKAKPADRVILAGLGVKAKFHAEALRRAVSAVIRRLAAVRCREFVLLLPVEEMVGVDLKEQAQAAVEGALLTQYRFKRYKKKRKSAEVHPGHMRLFAVTEKQKSEMAEGARLGKIFTEGACRTRDLVNEPPSVATPSFLANAARTIAKGNARITLRVLDPAAIKKQKMGALLGVAAGSREPCRFIHLSYKAPGAKRTIALVGKGITFDSGGLCIKPAGGMGDMKADMSGAAIVLGVFQALRTLKPEINVHGIVPATENMPGGAAYKPSDVLTAMNGKTIEIINTDAEGRLILADALCYASKLKPDEIIDMATLTGAAVIALGTRISALYGTDAAMVDRLLQAGRAAGEKIWHMPLEEEYWDLIKTPIADMKNCGPRWGGSITAALLLKEFVDPEISWAHIDLSNDCLPAEGRHHYPAGATGVVVRTILRYLRAR